MKDERIMQNGNSVVNSLYLKAEVSNGTAFINKFSPDKVIKVVASGWEIIN